MASDVQVLWSSPNRCLLHAQLPSPKAFGRGSWILFALLFSALPLLLPAGPKYVPKSPTPAPLHRAILSTQHPRGLGLILRSWHIHFNTGSGIFQPIATLGCLGTSQFCYQTGTPAEKTSENIALMQQMVQSSCGAGVHRGRVCGQARGEAGSSAVGQERSLCLIFRASWGQYSVLSRVQHGILAQCTEAHLNPESTICLF